MLVSIDEKEALDSFLEEVVVVGDGNSFFWIDLQMKSTCLFIGLVPPSYIVLEE